MNLKLLYIDTETTGLDSTKHGITQIAGIVDIDGEVKETFNFLMQPFPGDVIDSKALEVQKTTIEILKLRPQPQEIYPQLIAILKKYGEESWIVAGHNIRYDIGMLTSWFKKNNDSFDKYLYQSIDTVTLARSFMRTGKLATANAKLGTIASHFNLTFNAHEAGEDIRITREIHRKFLEMLSRVPAQ